jgi:hypothetical protein
VDQVVVLVNVLHLLWDLEVKVAAWAVVGVDHIVPQEAHLEAVVVEEDWPIPII